MMPVFVDSKFTQGFTQRRSSDGQVLVSGDVLTCSGNDGAAFRDYLVPVKKGQIIEVEVMAKKIIGDVRVSVDFVKADGGFRLADYIKIKNEEWGKHKLSVTVPYENIDFVYARVSFGKWDSVKEQSEGKFQDPKISISNGIGAPSTVAAGLIRLSSLGEATIHNQSFRSYGIESVSYDETTKELTVTLDRGFLGSMRPLIIATGTSDDFVIPVVGEFSGGSKGSFKIKWTDGSSFVDHGRIRYVNLYVFM